MGGKGHICIISYLSVLRKGALMCCQKIICVAHCSTKVKGEELLLSQLYR